MIITWCIMYEVRDDYPRAPLVPTRAACHSNSPLVRHVTLSKIPMLSKQPCHKVFEENHIPIYIKELTSK